MERLTTNRTWKEARRDLHNELGYSHIWKRLNAIENILGDDYDLDRLRELAQADRERHAKHYRWMAPVCVGCPGKTEEGECNGVLRIPGQRGALY